MRQKGSCLKYLWHSASLWTPHEEKIAPTGPRDLVFPLAWSCCCQSWTCLCKKSVSPLFISSSKVLEGHSVVSPEPPDLHSEQGQLPQCFFIGERLQPSLIIFTSSSRSTLTAHILVLGAPAVVPWPVLVLLALSQAWTQCCRLGPTTAEQRGQPLACTPLFGCSPAYCWPSVQ